MIEFAGLLKSAAGEIDAIDADIASLNDDKKAIYQNVRETVAPAEYKAWRDAVKLRQKRRVDRDAMDAHDARVSDMLHMLEASGTVHAIARAQVREAAGEGEAAAESSPAVPPHDPETGEIVHLMSGARQ